MSKLLENEVTAKIVETKSMKATITIQKILDIICEKWSSCLDGYYIYNEEPVLSSDNYSDTSVTVNLYNSDRVKIDNIIDDVTMLFEEELEDFVKKEQNRHDDTIATFKKVKETKLSEEGENGSL
tara:strand:- start:2471 stop:2845 length:375 start_codon:yes stop_codon:yes gene_type:complete